jgi:hypothetical protein
MTKSRTMLAAAIALTGLWTTPAAAQIDIMSAGEMSANVGRTTVMTDAITREAARSRSDAGTAKARRAAATCANKDAARAKHGADDPRVQQLYRLCAQAGF